MIVTHKVTMDLVQGGAMPKLSMVQGDANTRVVELALYSDGMDWTVPEDVSASLRYCKSDGTKGVYDTLPDGTRAWRSAGNVLAMTLAPQVLTAAGAVFAQLELISEGSVLASFTFQICVEPNPAAGVLQSEDYVNWVQWMEGELEAFLRQARDSGDFTGPRGEAGATYMPSVSQEGTLSWSNDRELENPPEVNLMGMPGKSAYDFAVEGGFRGSEEEFTAKLAAAFLPTGGAVSGSIHMSGNRITGLGAPEEEQDAATKGYVDGKKAEAVMSLSAAGWNENRQRVPVAAVKGDSTVLVSPVPESWEEYGRSGVRCVSQEDGMLEFLCENVPDVDLTVCAVILN